MNDLADELDHLAQLLADMPRPDGPRGPHRRDRIFVRLFECLGPRIRHLIQRYGLSDMREDAEQACAIGVHRALENYDPAKSRFTTHVTWQLRGELQGLRHRMRLDQRQSARSAQIRTVSLDALTAEREERAEPIQIVDEGALASTERSCSDALAVRCLARLMDRIGSPALERTIVLEALFERDGDAVRHGKTREQRRQIVRRTFRNCAKVMAAEPVAA